MEEKKTATPAQSVENYEDDDDLIGLITSNADASGQYVIFNNGFDKLYAINVAKVEELIARNEIELSENSNPSSLVSGVAKVRGNIIPIVKFDRWLGREADESVYELIMVCNYGSERLGLVIKNVLGILSIDSEKMTDNSDRDDKTSFITEVSLGGISGLCLVFDSDKMLMEVFPNIERTEMAKMSEISLGRSLKGKLLSAEDSGVMRKALIAVYEQLGIDYEVFKDGSLLLARVKELDPDNISLIITDLEMPVMDGLKMIEAIKEEVRYADIPIVVNTNMANGSVSNKCFALGVNHIISKLDVQELSDTIKKHAR
jgi:two-component system, chemotaxis family, chemotaxis protein CheV